MNTLKRRLLPLSTALLVLVACTAPQVDLKPGDRIIFLGDSTTQAGDQTGGYVTIVRDTLTARHPELGLQIIGTGVSGDKVPDLQERLYRDVLSNDPTIVFVYAGVNDVWHSIKAAGGTPLDRYKEGLRVIIGRVTAAGARVLLCTPAVVGERHDGTNPLDGMLDEYTAVSRQLAGELKVPLVDLRKTFLNYLRKHNPENGASGILTYDGVHLNAEGHRLVAREVLKVLHP